MIENANVSKVPYLLNLWPMMKAQAKKMSVI